MLSIIIPTLNEEKFLPLLLASIKKQSFTDYEIIVADAGSKDKTAQIAQQHGCTLVKGGLLPYGRNRGADAARGEWLLFLDSDAQFPHPDFLKNVMAQVTKANVGIAGFPLMPSDGNIVDKLALGAWSVWARISQSFHPYAASAIFASKKAHTAIGGFDEKIVFVEDLPYARAAAKVANFKFIQEPVFVSARRYKKDGRLATYIRYGLAELHLMLIGPIYSDFFKYQFGHYKEESSSKQ